MPVNIIDTLKPKNGLDFPVVEAVDVAVEGYTSLADAVTHFATDAMIAAINTALTGKANAADVTTSVANLQGQIDQIVISASAEAVVAPEVAQARVSEDGTEYDTLKDRLDTQDKYTQNSLSVVNSNFIEIESAFGFSNSIAIEYTSNEVPQPDGTFYEDTGATQHWFGSGYVEIPEGTKKIYYRGKSFKTGQTVITPIAFYDAEYNILSSAPATGFITVEGVIDVPSDAKYFYQTQFYSTTDPTGNSNNYTRMYYGKEYDLEKMQTSIASHEEELTELQLELAGGSEKPVGEPGTKSTTSTDSIWFQYAEVISRITRIKYTAVEGTINFYRITYVEDASTLEYEPIISVENTADETGTIKTIDVDFTLSENQYVGINGAFRFKNSDVYYSRNYNLATGKISNKAGQYLDFVAEYAESISAKVNNLENELDELNARTDALEDAINNPTVDKTLRRHGEVVLYEHSFKSSDSEFVGTQVFDNYGIVVTDRVYLERSYAVSDRTVKYVCKFTATSSALFEVVTENGTTVNTRIIVDVPDKTVTLYGKTAETCSFLNDTDEFMVSITKNYQDLRINVTNIYTGEELNLEYTMSGTGGVGAGAIEVDKYNSVPMQHCYYAVLCRNNSSFSISKMIVVSAKCDLLIYGDSITEGEAYWPHDLFSNHWVQKLVKSTDGKALSSGRSGGNFDDIYSRMQNEIPYIKPKYVMITTGTNGQASVENYTTMVQYIKSQGCIPILNHIPCYDNNGDTTGFIARNANIDEVRASENVRGVDFDLATSIAHDGQEVDISSMWYEDYSSTSGRHYYHHPNVKGCAAMFQRIMIDTPEIFDI